MKRCQKCKKPTTNIYKITMQIKAQQVETIARGREFNFAPQQQINRFVMCLCPACANIEFEKADYKTLVFGGKIMVDDNGCLYQVNLHRRDFSGNKNKIRKAV